MLACNISSAQNMASGSVEYVETLRVAFDRLAMMASSADAADRPQNADVGPSLASRYAASAPIVQRRIDALMREAQVIGSAGMRLIGSRRTEADAATVAAARFLGNSLDAILRKVDASLAPSAA